MSAAVVKKTKSNQVEVESAFKGNSVKRLSMYDMLVSSATVRPWYLHTDDPESEYAMLLYT